MSPLPSPVPLRRAILRMLFSPASLLLGFVVFIITTCPGARGEDAVSLLVTNGGLMPRAGADVTTLDVAVIPTRPAVLAARSTRFDRVPASSARSSTPAERVRLAPAPTGEIFTNSRSTLPLLTDPLLDAASPSASLSPMTGPAVGIRSQLPSALR